MTISSAALSSETSFDSAWPVDTETVPARRKGSRSFESIKSLGWTPSVCAIWLRVRRNVGLPASRFSTVFLEFLEWLARSSCVHPFRVRNSRIFSASGTTVLRWLGTLHHQNAATLLGKRGHLSMILGVCSVESQGQSEMRCANVFSIHGRSTRVFLCLDADEAIKMRGLYA